MEELIQQGDISEQEYQDLETIEEILGEAA